MRPGEAEGSSEAKTGPLSGQTIGLGVGGGIAAYKSLELLRLLVKAGADVHVAMSAGAREFIAPLSFQALSGHRVFTDMFSESQEAEIGHIAIGDRVDAVVIAPATANLLSRLWAGAANCPVTSMVLATKAPVIVAPAMNVNMWEKSVTQRNWQQLKHMGMIGVEPAEGFLACGWQGAGRMSEASDILEKVISVLSKKDLKGRRVLVTAGPTEEDLDPVRFLSNRSTGKMGYAVALEAARRGAEVDLVTGPVAIGIPAGVARVHRVRSAKEMAKAVYSLAETADIIIKAAAVADFTPQNPAESKIKKGDGATNLSTVSLQSTDDILQTLGKKSDWKRGKRPLLVGFAAETEALAKNAFSKKQSKGADLVVANDVSRKDIGFGSDENEVLFVDDKGAQKIPKSSKLEIAGVILDWCSPRLGPLENDALALNKKGNEP